jgi:beta-glucosidase
MAPGAAFGRSGGFEGEKSLRQAVDDGEVPVSRIDDLIRRRLEPPFRLGVFENPAKKKADDISTPERRVALVDVITGGAVLLKNKGGVLPFGAGVKTVAIIGAQATEKAVAVEQGSAHVKPTHFEPVLPAVQARAGQNVQVLFAQGTLGLGPLPLAPKSMLKTPSGQAGVKVEYFANPRLDFSGKPLATRTEDAFTIDKAPQIDGLPKDGQYSIRYTALFTPEKTGVQKFTLAVSGTARLFIGGKAMGEVARADFSDTVFANVRMTAGTPVEIRLEYTPREVLGDVARPQFDIIFGLYFALGWSGPDDLIAQAAETAKKADVAVVFVGHVLGEGMDRLSLALPNDQGALIEAVAKANPRTVVVLNTGGAVTMPWLDRVAAVLEMWLPGDSYGPAAAKLLFGDAEPGGRLPVTFPKDETQGPATKTSQYPGTLSDKGALETAAFDEGIFIGYRYWDQYNQAPLFPFGYGLSYSSFAMKGLGVTPSPNGATVNVSVRNTGARAGSEVVQVYLAFPKAAGEPPKQLRGFEKVTLGPGAETTVRIALHAEAFQYWNGQTHAWTTSPGDYQVMAGRSSRDIVFTTRVPAPADAIK